VIAMGPKQWVCAVLCLAFVAVLGACGETRPYVYKTDEFDREADTFNKAPEDRDSVTICYNKLGTTPEIVFELATTECGKYAKRARRTHQNFGDCPMATPVEAHFACEKPYTNGH
jgi:hypothetical protein